MSETKVNSYKKSGVDNTLGDFAKNLENLYTTNKLNYNDFKAILSPYLTEIYATRLLIIIFYFTKSNDFQNTVFNIFLGNQTKASLTEAISCSNIVLINTISQSKSMNDSGADEFVKIEGENAHRLVGDLKLDFKKDEGSFKSGNWYYLCRFYDELINKATTFELKQCYDTINESINLACSNISTYDYVLSHPQMECVIQNLNEIYEKSLTKDYIATENNLDTCQKPDTMPSQINVLKKFGEIKIAF